MKILVAMSGGVDSSVAALLLKEQGAQIAGITMRWWQPSERQPHENVIEDARRVCRALSITHDTADCQALFNDTVIDPFVRGYVSGRTPNPCVLCNRHLKFGLLLQTARARGFDALATGHYARIERREGLYCLCTALQKEKDQSYALYTLDQTTLPFIRFPLGELSKARIREIAAQAGLPVAHKRDSQEICFVQDGDYAGFVARHADPRALRRGDIVDEQGRVRGRHQGVWRYTVGQRKGLGNHWGRPVYVTAIDAQTNTVTVGGPQALMRDTAWAGDVSFTAGAPPENPAIQAKLRYSAAPARALLASCPDGRWQIRFEQPQRAVTPGQAVVFYDGDRVLGGGTILPVT